VMGYFRAQTRRGTNRSVSRGCQTGLRTRSIKSAPRKRRHSIEPQRPHTHHPPRPRCHDGPSNARKLAAAMLTLTAAQDSEYARNRLSTTPLIGWPEKVSGRHRVLLMCSLWLNFFESRWNRTTKDTKSTKKRIARGMWT
jgi:hypothetical protein